MAVNEGKKSEPGKRTVVCECGLELDLRTQGLLCVGCRAKFRVERRSNMAAAWERFHRRHSGPSYGDEPSADVEALVDAIDRLVDALDHGRPGYGRQTRPSTSLVLPSPRAGEPRRGPEPRRVGGIPVDRLERD